MTVLLAVSGCSTQHLDEEARSGLVGDPYPEPPERVASTLRMLVWPETILASVKQNFETRYHVKLKIDTFSNNDEAYARTLAEPSKWDLVMLGQYMADRMRRENLLKPIPRLNEFVYRYIDASILNQNADPQMKYFVPFDYAALGISFNVDYIAGFPKTWEFLFDQKSNPISYGRVALPDDMRFAMAAAMLYAGLEPTSTKPEDIETAKLVLLRMVRELGLVFIPDPMIRAKMVNRDTVVAVTWSAEAAGILKIRSGCRFLIPEGRSIMAVDGFVLPKGGENSETAALFIEYMLHPYTSLQVANQTMYASVNKRSMKQIDRFMINSPSTMVAPHEAQTHMVWLGEEALKRYEAAWAEVKAAQPEMGKISLLPAE